MADLLYDAGTPRLPDGITLPGQGATVEHLLARAVASPFGESRTYAIAQLRRALAVGRDPKDRTNLSVSGSGRLSESELAFIGSTRLEVGE